MKRLFKIFSTLILALGLALPLTSAQAGDGEDMIQAAFDGYVQDVNTFLQQGIDVDFHLDDGTTALIIASYNGHIGVVLTLLDNGADIDHQSGMGTTPLIMAAGQGHIGVINILIANGVDINQQVPGQFTALKVAKTEEVRQLLIANGATE